MSAAEPKFPPPDPAAFARELAELAGKAQAMFAELLKTPTARAAFGLEQPSNPDPLNAAPAMQAADASLLPVAYEIAQMSEAIGAGIPARAAL